jgi:hypothetical protein
VKGAGLLVERHKMTVTLEEFTKDFTPEERAKVAARTAELIEEEFVRRRQGLCVGGQTAAIGEPQ